ncbi:hypothetical protein [Candidatus Nitrososphaera gargensis]|uniref:hypothetical protein n=1 Tax=Candidatus Nitrososphaera gargensis TaxID=497727 RepID=UPI001E551EAA|nr:hypothetical protein [Candidatus Nitrososphaera gargensis]
MPSTSGMRPISIKSTRPFADLGFKYSSKNLARRKNPLPKSSSILVPPSSSRRILLPPTSFTPAVERYPAAGQLLLLLL